MNPTKETDVMATSVPAKATKVCCSRKVQVLIEQSTALGGARPFVKVRFPTETGQLLIAYFYFLVFQVFLIDLIISP